MVTKKFFLFFCLFFLGIIGGCFILIFLEINDAKTFCEDSNNTYKLNITNIFVYQHLCNDVELFKYTDGKWGYDLQINYSKLLRIDDLG